MTEESETDVAHGCDHTEYRTDQFFLGEVLTLHSKLSDLIIFIIIL